MHHESIILERMRHTKNMGSGGKSLVVTGVQYITVWNMNIHRERIGNEKIQSKLIPLEGKSCTYAKAKEKETSFPDDS